MGFKQDVVDDLHALNSRVTALESLAATLRTAGMPASVQGTTRTDYADTQRTQVEDRTITTVRNPGAYDGITGGRRGTAVSTPATGVDYGAIAFGLSQIKADAAANLNNAVPASALAKHYRETVQYFSDVFAKADPSFDAADFARKANA